MRGIGLHKRNVGPSAPPATTCTNHAPRRATVIDIDIRLLVSLIFASSCIPFWLYNTVQQQLQKHNRSEFPKIRSSSIIQQVDIQSIAPIDPVYIGQLNSSDVPYLVSFPWWDSRINKTNFKAKKPIWAHPTVTSVQMLINETNVDDAFIDVGANVGFMALYALNRKNPVYAIEPISWNVAKICEGINANIERGWVTSEIARERFHLYHAAAGPSARPWINVIRPSDDVGHFDAASLSKEALGQTDLVTERIPLITVDSLIPNNLNVGVVKIDVQGHEFGVLSGMKKLLGRKVGFPKYVFYEDDHVVTRLAGYNPGDCEKLLGDFGYTCIVAPGGDKQCQK